MTIKFAFIAKIMNYNCFLFSFPVTFHEKVEHVSTVSWSCHPLVINVLKIYPCPSESTAEHLRKKSVVMYRSKGKSKIRPKNRWRNQ